MKLTEIYKKKESVISFEIFPPKRDEELANIDATLDELALLKPDYISVTFGAGGTSNNNKTIDIARKIKEQYKIEPVVHLTGLYYDVTEIDEFVKELLDAGVENILALRGDINPNVPAKSDFPYAAKLIEYIKETTGDAFCIAGGCYPENHPDTANSVDEIRYAKAKVDAGAEVLLSLIVGWLTLMSLLHQVLCLLLMLNQSEEWLICVVRPCLILRILFLINTVITRKRCWMLEWHMQQLRLLIY